MGGRVNEKDVELAREAVEALALAVHPGGVEIEPLVQREMALYIALPADKRREVEERLHALAALPREGRTVADVMRVAEDLGIERSNVYRLLKRVEELGPVAGLVPGRRARERASSAKDGFGEPIDGWIEDLLEERPEAGIAEIRRMIASRMLMMPQAGEAEAVAAAPASSALARRVHELRRRGIRRVGAAAAGAALLVDYCPVDLSLTETGERFFRLANLVVIVDQATSIVFGAGFFLGEHVAQGLVRALDQMDEHVLPSLVGRGLLFADRLERVRWIVSSDLVDAAGQAAGVATALSPRVRFEGEHGGRGLPGTEMHRRLGNSLGLVRFRLRSERLERQSYRRPVSFEAGERMLLHEVRQRNERLMEAARDADLPAPFTDRPSEQWLAAVAAIFGPVKRRSTDRDGAGASSDDVD